MALGGCIKNLSNLCSLIINNWGTKVRFLLVMLLDIVRTSIHSISVPIILEMKVQSLSVMVSSIVLTSIHLILVTIILGAGVHLLSVIVLRTVSNFIH